MEREEREARLEANQAALTRLNEIAQRNPSKDDALQRLRVEYEGHIRQVEGAEPCRNGRIHRRIGKVQRTWRGLLPACLRMASKLWLCRDPGPNENQWRCPATTCPFSKQTAKSLGSLRKSFDRSVITHAIFSVSLA